MFRFYLDNCKALVFVVDSSDRSRLPEAQKALKKILSEEKMQEIPLMVLANKRDLPNCMTIREVRTLRSPLPQAAEQFNRWSKWYRSTSQANRNQTWKNFLFGEISCNDSSKRKVFRQ